MSTSPEPASDHPLSVLQRRSRRARLSHPRLRLRGRDAHSATPSGGVHGEASFQGQLVMIGQGALRTRSQDAGATPAPRTMGVFIYLDDVDAHYTAAKTAGAEIVHPPKNVDYGRTYSALDPEGHPWFFTSPPKAG